MLKNIAEKDHGIANCNVIPVLWLCPQKNRCESGRNLFFSGKRPGMLGTGMLGMTTVALSKKLNLAQPTISHAAMHGKKIAEEEGFKTIREANLRMHQMLNL
jgi:hypothetical protein